jgi:succinate dehydrogenase hydrophobic anchor subunit
MEAAEKLLLKKYGIHFLRTMLMLAAVVALAVLTKPEPKGPVWKAIFLTAVAAISIHFLWGTWRIIRTGIKTDEMGDAIWMRGGSYAHSASILLASLYGLLEGIGGLPRVSMTVVSVVMIVIGFLSVALVQRRYA